MVSDITNNDKKRWRQIRSSLFLLDTKIADIARKLGVSGPMVTMTIKGRRKSLRVRQAIADALGKKITDLWPDETRHLKRREK